MSTRVPAIAMLCFSKCAGQDRKASSLTAFTLIEVLVVIAIIGVLAGLLFVVVKPIKVKKMIAVAQAELAQMETAIDAYKGKYGFYPPDNPGNPVVHQLYFELAGTALANLPGSQVYVTLDSSASIPATPAAFQSAYGASTSVSGFVNTSKTARGNDDTGTAENFLKDLKPKQTGALTAVPSVRILICSVLSEKAPFLVPGDTTGMSPWQYNASHPTNNPSSYDLWVDLSIGGKIYRVSNWSTKPQAL
jgi:prepilin-type N-terminal cleavage/methylation domain-containing protein